MKHLVVVARWDEEVRWAAGYPHVIYDKGGAPLDSKGLSVVRLEENPEGHETHTYLQHIIQHYDELAEWTTFCQGWPFDHASQWDQEWNAEPENGFAWVGHSLVTDDRNGQPHHYYNPIPVGLAYTRILGKPAPKQFEFIAGCQFVASREKIRSRPRVFYERIQALGMTAELEKDWGYTMERLWGYVLND